MIPADDLEGMVRHWLKSTAIEGAPRDLAEAVADATRMKRQRPRRLASLWGTLRLDDELGARPDHGLLRIGMDLRAGVAAVAAFALVAVGAAAWVSRPGGSSGSPSASPGPSATAAAAAPSSSASLAAGTPRGTVSGPLRPGASYVIPDLGVPLSVKVPRFPGGGPTEGDWVGRGTYRLFTEGSRFSITIQYAASTAVDICHPDLGTLPGEPSTVAGVGVWLAADPAVKVSAPTSISVDGHQSRYWDVTLGSDCWAGTGFPPYGPAVWFSAGERHRVYAVWTGVRTVVVTEWAPATASRDPAWLSTVDEFVASLTFP